MHDRANFEIAWPKVKEKERRKEESRAVANEWVAFDPELFDALKRVRTELALKEGSVPAYVIFADETLRAFAQLKPRTIEAAKRIRGVGEIKAIKYVPAMLKVIVAPQSMRSANDFSADDLPGDPG
jgi:superfamily II DNA helicase RecQ